MTNDDLIQFAAEKVRERATEYLGRLWVASKNRPWIDDPTSLSGGYWQETLERLDLDSWELFGRGLAAYKKLYLHHFTIECPKFVLHVGDSDTPKKDVKMASCDFVGDDNDSNVADLPRSFWTAWYRLEHDET